VVTLVPPKTIHPGSLYESYVATPVPGSATAETSPTERREHAVPVCHAGWTSASGFRNSNAEHRAR
jgi:hypothetical protein